MHILAQRMKTPTGSAGTHGKPHTLHVAPPRTHRTPSACVYLSFFFGRSWLE